MIRRGPSTAPELLSLPAQGVDADDGQRSKAAVDNGAAPGALYGAVSSLESAMAAAFQPSIDDADLQPHVRGASNRGVWPG